jgi:uracil-DNA glycosylase
VFFEAMHPEWQALLANQRDLLAEIEATLPGDYLPAREFVMRAFASSPTEQKVVIIGQDPYPTPGHAIGLSFAVAPGTPLPRSLSNMMKELRADFADDLTAGLFTTDGQLLRWAEQGVLLLNRELTIPGHKKWEQFTDAALRALVAARGGKVVVILWGNHAAKAEAAAAGAVVLRSAHPSPLSASRGFFGSKPYSKANEALRAMGVAPIDWSC